MELIAIKNKPHWKCIRSNKKMATTMHVAWRCFLGN